MIDAILLHLLDEHPIRVILQFELVTQVCSLSLA